MRVDIDSIAAAIEARRRKRRELGIGLWCSNTESRVLGAMLAEHGVLERCDDVEVDDFADMRYRLIFGSLRNTQARGEHIAASDGDWGPVDLDAIMRDLERGGYHAITWFDLGDLIVSTSNYGPQDTVQLARDLTWLRTLANRRKAL